MAESRFEQINKETYSTPEAVEIYSERYLWPYEEFMLREYLKSVDKALDIGCGTGRSTIYLAERAKEVTGVDMSEPFIEQGKKLYPSLDLRVMNAAELAFENDSFDFVFFSNQGIDYTDKREAILREAYRVTKPGGIFVYTGHNSLVFPQTRKRMIDFLKHFWVWRPGYHVKVEHHKNGDLYVSHNNIWGEAKLIKRSGFELVEILNNRLNPRRSKLFTAFLERWPMYVCRKPQY